MESANFSLEVLILLISAVLDEIFLLYQFKLLY